MANYCEKLGEMTPDNLVASIHVKQITGSVIVASGAGVLKRGTVLAKDTAGKMVAMAEGKTPYGILCDDVDATAADEVGEAYLTGCFNKNALHVASGYELTDADITALRNGGIYLENSVR